MTRETEKSGVQVSGYKDFCIHLTHTVEREAVANGECVCRGDPHCFPFDANRFNNDQELFTPNVCGYVMATDRCSEFKVFPQYIISAAFKRVKYIGMARSFVSGVSIEYLNKQQGGYLKINLNQGLEVIFDGQKVEEFPKEIDGHKFEMVPAVFAHPKDFTEGVTEVMSYTLPNGINVQYDGIKGVKINVDSFEGTPTTCGLCGNNDGILDGKDFALGGNVNGAKCDGLPVDGSEREMTSDKQAFVNSWYHFSTDDEECTAICPV
ncbi:hypothetical protein CAPTEDRAFT_220804 [Capitella teleta]|uniref:VWFD domain-containing protein n=1 Tax=Capitella teleta TaxID=283909 RepID=R7U2S1_CAPTE|nr:hypothetical protein CAPTEDRAFT_220804 [Capitella teleta]|eukprot:ELU00173.1 hypothetical protein CAPTEDRAFT_220804 [Capitella teleta]